MLFLLQLPLPLAAIHPLKGRSIHGSHSSHILWYLVHFRLCSRARVTARLVHWLCSCKPAEERDRQTGSEGVVRTEQENADMGCKAGMSQWRLSGTHGFYLETAVWKENREKGVPCWGDILCKEHEEKSRVFWRHVNASGEWGTELSSKFKVWRTLSWKLD